MNRLKSNFIYDAVYQLLIMIIPLITTPYVARTIGATGLGIYSYTYSIVYYFMMIALLGTNHYGNREISKVKDNRKELNKTFSSIYYLQLIINGLVTVIYLIYVFYFGHEYFKYQLIQIIYVLSVAFDINWFFCGLQEFKLTITRSAAIKIITFLSIFLFVKGKNDLYIYIMILALSTLLNQVVLFPFLKGKVSFTKVKPKEILAHVKPTLILFIPVIATSIYQVMSKIIIGNIVDVNEVAYYENAEKILNIVLSLVSALGTVTLPEMTYLYKNEKYEEYYKIFNISVELIFFIVFPAIFGLLSISTPLIKLYLGNEFDGAIPILRILCWSLAFKPIATIIRMQLLIPRSKDKEYTISIVVGALVNLILNLILIKLFNGIGAAVATVCAELIVCVLHCYFVKSEINFVIILKSILKFLVSSLIMFVVIIFLGSNINNNIVKIILEVTIGGAIYFIINIKYIKKYINITKFRKGEC